MHAQQMLIKGSRKGLDVAVALMMAIGAVFAITFVTEASTHPDGGNNDFLSDRVDTHGALP